MTLTLGTLAIYAAISLGLGSAGWLAGKATADIINELKRKGINLEDSKTKEEWVTKAEQDGITNDNITQKENSITPSNTAINATPGAKTAVVEMGKQDINIMNEYSSPQGGLITDVSNVQTPTWNPTIVGPASGNAAANPKEEDGSYEINPILPSTGTGNNNNEDKTMNDPIPSIEDKTEDNIISEIPQWTNTNEYIKWAEENQKKQWEREDAIRKETQEREDTAYQRAVADMKKAGINPNLMNINPAESGGGITQATGMDASTINKILENKSNELVAFLNREFEGDENTKKQLTSLFSQILQGLAMYMTFGGG